jgi:4-hydroxybutyrate CoA-transferase
MTFPSPIRDAYERKRLREDEVLAFLHDGATVYVNGGTGLPNRFMQLLGDNAGRFADIRLCHPMRREAMKLSSDPCAADLQDSLYHVSDFTFDKPVREAIRAGRATFRPIQPNLAARHFPYPIDLLVAAASPMDEHGFFSLGAFGGWIRDFIGLAKTIVLEVNPRQPRVHGDNFIHLDRVAGILEADYALVGIQQSAAVAGAQEQAIARHVAGIVKDGATLQVGAGQVPDAVVKLLVDSGRRDIGIHSEALSDWAVDLHEAGILTNARKSANRGKTVAAMIFGSERLYRFIHDNPAVEVHPTSHVNDPAVIARNHRPVSINTTIMIDLFGQCASESIGPMHYSGTGGQWNFHYGASLSPEGCAVMALQSTSRGGAASRIVPTLPPGSIVSIPRNDLHYVATEHGIHDMRGISMEERARRLIALADPRYRDGLERAARDDLRLLRASTR